MESTAAVHQLTVIVHYMAALHPFKDEHVSRSETVATLKAQVLKAFGLTEGSSPDGSSVSYHLYHKKAELTDGNQTLGSVSGDDKVLELKLVQKLTQG